LIPGREELLLNPTRTQEEQGGDGKRSKKQEKRAKIALKRERGYPGISFGNCETESMIYWPLVTVNGESRAC
jgi:hypothetical protein